MTMQERSLPFGPQKIHFPEDEGAHPEFLAEWWYGHFSLTDSGGREYGAMVAYFNFGLKILAISDLEAERLYHTASASALHHAEGFFELRWGGRDHWLRTDPNSLSYHLESYGTDMNLNLDIWSEKPPLLGCGNGLIRWSGGKSYYYAHTRLQAKGQIQLSGRTIDVDGIGLTDHQWMDYADEGGWDWFGVQLENKAEIVLWHIVNLDGSIRSRDLTIMFPDNSVYYTKDLVLERMDSWVSPDSGREYGLRWRVREETQDLDLEIRARYARQEIRLFEDISAPTFPFWEGGMTVSGRLRGEAVSGIGCAEFVRFSNSDG